MKKESGVAKWFARLKAYGYINPEDGGEAGPPPQSTIDDGGIEKTEKAEPDLIDQSSEPRSKPISTPGE